MHKKAEMLTVYPWAFLFALRVLANLRYRQKFTDYIFGT